MTAFPTAGAGATFSVVGALIGPGTNGAYWSTAGATPSAVVLEAVPRFQVGDSFRIQQTGPGTISINRSCLHLQCGQQL